MDIYRKLLYYVNVVSVRGQFVYWFGYLALSLSLGAVPTLAHGGGTPQLINADIGPYWISTWIRPDPPETDNFHLTVALSEPTDPTAAIREAGPPVLNAVIEVQLQSATNPALIVSGRATHDQAVNKYLYEADITLPEAGQWHGLITVERTDTGTGSIAFDVDVVSSTQLNITMVVGVSIGLLLVATWAMRRTLAASV